MSDDYILILANVRLMPTSEGGRDVPVTGSYRPNHNFFAADNREMTVSFIEIPEGRSLSPGDTTDLPIRLWKWDRLEGEIYPGRQWLIQEGRKVVGMGTVMKVLQP